jgi:hypothetical protein
MLPSSKPTKLLSLRLEDGKLHPRLRARARELTISQYRFLLKYASRDKIELLGKGTAGVSETRLAVEEYEEKSPLYGLVQYRRRKVILKYVPEGTSRLLQGLLRIHRWREHY